jgi:hypothetical protein
VAGREPRKGVLQIEACQKVETSQAAEIQAPLPQIILSQH